MQGLMSSSHNVTERRVVCVCTCSIRFVQELNTFEIYSRHLVKHRRASFSSLYSLCNLTVEEHLTQHCDATGMSCLAPKVYKHWIPIHSLSLSGNVLHTSGTLDSGQMFWALVGTIDTEYNTLHGRACTYTSTSGLFSAFSYIILVTGAHEQPVNSAAVSDKTQARPCVRQQG